MHEMPRRLEHQRRTDRHRSHWGVCSGLLLACLAASPARAYSDFGHELVARVAWQRLSPATRSAALELLHRTPVDSGLPGLYPTFHLPQADLDRIFFERAATWPDLARDLPDYDRPTWHYVNRFWERSHPSLAPIDRVDLDTPKPNIVTQLVELEGRLADRSRSKGERGLDLAWILHLVGDIHQPLHCSSRVEPGGSEETGDRGGNEFPLRNVSGNDLHGLWDFAVEGWQPRGESEPFRLWIDRITDELQLRHPLRHVSEATLRPGDFAGWADESYLLTKTIGYPSELVPGRAPPDGYRELAFDVALERIALAARRLAALLEQALAEEAAEPAVENDPTNPPPRE